LLDENAQAEGFALIEHILGGELGNSSEHSKLIQRMDGSTVSVTLVGRRSAVPESQRRSAGAA
jgi:3'-phosphoadenosine 5'-phosphosulfate sulfotransferase